VDKPKFPEIVPEENVDNVLDLDAYRARRVEAKTWPLSREELFKFWYEWRRNRRK
jgi:hypothetical protein